MKRFSRREQTEILEAMTLMEAWATRRFGRGYSLDRIQLNGMPNEWCAYLWSTDPIDRTPMRRTLDLEHQHASPLQAARGVLNQVKIK